MHFALVAITRTVIQQTILPVEKPRSRNILELPKPLYFKFQSDPIIFTANRAASRLHEILTIRCLTCYWNGSLADCSRVFSDPANLTACPFSFPIRWTSGLLIGCPGASSDILGDRDVSPEHDNLAHVVSWFRNWLLATLGPKQSGWHFAKDICKYISMCSMKHICVPGPDELLKKSS